MEKSECTCRHKTTPRDEEFQANLQRRLNRAIGQLKGVKAMLDDNRYCGDVLIQISAAGKALDSLGMSIMKSHLESCVVDEIQSGNTEVTDEVMELIKRLR